MSNKLESSYNGPPPAYPQPDRAQSSGYTQPAYASTPPMTQQPQYQPVVNTVYMSPCAQGHHNSSVRFGLCGILAAIFCFPIGFICMCLDTERVCSRCGVRL